MANLDLNLVFSETKESFSLGALTDLLLLLEVAYDKAEPFDDTDLRDLENEANAGSVGGRLALEIARGVNPFRIRVGEVSITRSSVSQELRLISIEHHSPLHLRISGRAQRILAMAAGITLLSSGIEVKRTDSTTKDHTHVVITEIIIRSPVEVFVEQAKGVLSGGTKYEAPRRDHR